MNKPNILIVEDHALTRFALLTSLKGEDFIGDIFEAANAIEAYNILGKNKIGLILMDLGLPDINGVEATKEIKKKHKNIKIIVITSHSEETEVRECLEAGISAYCSKDIEPKKLINLIKDVLSGCVWYDSMVSEYVLKMAKGGAPKEKTDAREYNLTTKEKQVLELLKKGNSNNEIAKTLNISVNTTKVHVCSILQKLEVDDRCQAAIKAIKNNIG